MNYHDIIIEPGKRGGSPWVGSRRSTAYEVLDPGFRRGNDGWRQSDDWQAGASR